MIKFLNDKKPEAVTYVALHHTAVSRRSQPQQHAGVERFHRNKDWGGGWKQPAPSSLGKWTGYNFFKDPVGPRIQCRAVGEETIANRGHNCDVPERCTAISYCMAGDFRVEKPTLDQVADFVAFVDEVRKHYPNVQIVQHHDLDLARTCAELAQSYIDSWFNEEDDAKIELLLKQIAILQQVIRLLLKQLNNQ